MRIVVVSLVDDPICLPVGFFVFAGQVEPKVAKMAVHICARVSALARSGEDLVSSTVRDIVSDRASSS
jgi:hypothetical protein